MPKALNSVIPPQPTLRNPNLMVGVMTGPNPPAVSLCEHLPRWRRLTPAAIWEQIRLRHLGEVSILQGLATALDRHSMSPRQLILLGQGTPARSALELVLRGTLACGGLIAIGQTGHALPFRLTPTRTAIRLVVHDGHAETPDDLIGALRAADIDERIVRLNAAAANDPRIVASAAETFILELVALTGRQRSLGSLQP